MGTQSAIISQAAPQIKCIVQDRDAVILDAAKVSLDSLHLRSSLPISWFQYFNGNAPGLLRSGQVVLQGLLICHCRTHNVLITIFQSTRLLYTATSQERESLLYAYGSA